MDTHQILLEKFSNDFPIAAAKAIEKLNDEDIASFFQKYPVKISVSIISYMQSNKAARCLELITPHDAIKIFEKLDLHVAELLLRQASEDFCNNILNGIAPKSAVLLREKLSHPDNTVGAFMTPGVLRLRKEISIQEAIATGRHEKANYSSMVFLVDNEGKLEGIVKMSDLLSHDSTTILSSIMIVEFPKFYADTDIESVSDHPEWYEFQDIPVVDSSERLIGTLHFKTTRKNKKDEGAIDDIIQASNALGELYRIGMTGFLQSVGK